MYITYKFQTIQQLRARIVNHKHTYYFLKNREILHTKNIFLPIFANQSAKDLHFK